MNRQVYLAAVIALLACAPDARIAHTVRLDIEFEDAAFDTTLINRVEIVLDANKGKMPTGLNRAVRRADTVEGIIVYSESRNVDDDRSDSEFVLSTEGNPFRDGRRAWGLDINGKDDTEFSVEARILNNANEIIARTTTSFDVSGRPIKFEDDYKHVVLRVRCEANANCTGGVTVVPNRPTDAGQTGASGVDAGATTEVDSGSEPLGTDAGTNEVDASTPPLTDAGPPPDLTPPAATSVTVSPTTVARGQNVLVEFNVTEQLRQNPDVVLDGMTMSFLSGGALSYKFKLLIPSSATGGAKAIAIRMVDMAGNVGNATATVSIDTTSGTADPAFGANGVRGHANAAGGGGDDFARAGAFDPNGRLVVVGKSRADAGSATIDRLALWRLTDAGTLDTGLQNTGYITHRGVMDGVTSANAVAIAPSGEVYVAGSSVDPNGMSHVAIWAFFSNGYPITSFGSAGVMTFNTSAGTGVANGLALVRGATSYNNLYAAGYTITSTSPPVYDVAIWKVTNTGTPDKGFNDAGAVIIPSPARGMNRAAGIVAGDGGVIYVVGTRYPTTTTNELGVWSFLPDGGVNAAFGTSGALSLSRTRGIVNDVGNAIALSGNSLYVAGQALNSANQPEATVWNLTTGGTVVTTFASTGVWTGAIPSSGTGTTAMSVAVDGRGRIVVGGGTTVPRTDEGLRVAGTVWRLTSAGAPDSLFNGTGTMTLPSATGVTNSSDAVYSVVVDGIDRVMAIGGGYNGTTNLDMAVWRVR